jgi:hypothetical protein
MRASETGTSAGSSAGEGSFSVAAWRGGTASRSTSERVPAYRSASTPASSATGPWRTGSGLTTRWIGVSVPVCSLSAARPRTNPSSDFPAKRTLTRAPGTAVSAIEPGTA